ncbi:MAG: peptidase M50 [Pyrodictiaceae archaeon]
MSRLIIGPGGRLSEAYRLLIAGVIAAFGLAGYRIIEPLWSPLSYGSGVLAGAVIGLILHEYMHKHAGRARGCWAEFVLSPQGIILTLFSGILRSLGLWFALIAPGYVALSCSSSVREGPIAAWGPLSNIVLAAVSAMLASIVSLLPGHSWEVYVFLLGFTSINSWIALFNLLPLQPLDGYKVFKENIPLWAVMIVFAAILVYFGVP